MGEGLIEVRSVRGTVVSERIPGSALQRGKLLKKGNGTTRSRSQDEFTEGLSRHWRPLDKRNQGGNHERGNFGSRAFQTLSQRACIG
jgi:hypothetical protein